MPAEKEKLLKEKVELTGIFDLGAVYSYIYAWLKYEDYITGEKDYYEKIGASEKEVIINWDAVKVFDSYFKSLISIKMEFRNLIEVEVEIEGKKKKMNKGRATIEINGFLIKDHNASASESGFYSWFKEMYEKFVIPARVEKAKDKQMKDVFDLKDALRAHFGMGVNKR